MNEKEESSNLRIFNEKEKIQNELEQGYKENSEYYLKLQEEWNYADNPNNLYNNMSF